MDFSLSRKKRQRKRALCLYDSLSEGRKVLVEQAGAILFTLARDVRVEFNPSLVVGYRLVGL